MSDNPADSLRRELEAEVLMACDRFVADNLRGTTGWQLKTAEALRDEIQPLVSAALEAARADERQQGRNDAARDIEAHRAKWAPMDGNMDQRRLSRHLGIAARVAQGPIDIEDVRVALERSVAVRGLGEGTENA